MSARLIVPLAAGALFGAGLALGGMTDPARVRGFIDIFGNWDPTLAFVMGGAVLVMAIAWRIQPKLTEPLFDKEFFLPGTMHLDPPLIIGAALFGIGWGIAGLCPGPGVAALVVAPGSAAIFLIALLAGMFAVRLTGR